MCYMCVDFVYVSNLRTRVCLIISCIKTHVIYGWLFGKGGNSSKNTKGNTKTWNGARYKVDGTWNSTTMNICLGKSNNAFDYNSIFMFTPIRMIADLWVYLGTGNQFTNDFRRDSHEGVHFSGEEMAIHSIWRLLFELASGQHAGRVIQIKWLLSVKI